MISFASPWVLALGAAVVAAAAYVTSERRRRQRIPALAVVPTRDAFWPGVVLSLLGLAAAWGGAAAPRTIVPAPSGSAGLDIVLLLDASGSMGERDARGSTRMRAAARVAARFAASRPTDRIGLVGFAGKAAVLAPPTTDHAAVVRLADSLQPAALGRGTAIGDGLAVAVERLRSVPRGSAAIVLVSDGRSNAGAIDPASAAAGAADLGIPVDAVAVGEGDATARGESVLRRVAAVTGGHFVRATDTEGVAAAFADLARLRPSPAPVEGSTTWADLAHVPARWAAVLLLAGAVLQLGGGRAW
ncbi:MAG: VWA domain-containing protein [Acidobacteriota bacterium]